MTTIKDIARLAGVSHGTVSNVLNKRGNVSIEKINLVENAARILGYKRNAQAQQLRQGRNKFVGSSSLISTKKPIWIYLRAWNIACARMTTVPTCIYPRISLIMRKPSSNKYWR